MQDQEKDQLIKEDSEMRRRTADTTTVGTMSLKPAPKDVLGGVILVCGTITALIGGLVLVGWVWDWGVLTSVRTDYIPMSPNSALLFILSGIALVVGGVWPANRIIRSSVNGAGLLTLIVAGTHLIGSAFGFDLEISHWLLPPTGTFGAVMIGHMSPISSFSFIFSGAALLLLGRQARETAGIMGTVVMLVGWVNVTGYWYGAPLLYGGTVIPVSLPTSLSLVLLGAGLIAAAGSQSWPLSIFSGPSTSALLLRGLLPAIVVIALIHGWLNAMALEKSDTSAVLESAAIGIVTVLTVFLVIAMQSRVIGDRIDLAEQELKESEERHRNLIEHLPQRIFIKDLNSVYMSCNANYASDRGLTPEQVVGKDDFAFHTPELAQAYRANDQACMAAGMVKDVEEPHHLAGQERWAHTIKVPYRDGQGRIIGVLGIYEDITERKRMEEELKISEEKFSKAFLLSPDAVSITRLVDGMIVSVNEGFKRMIGYAEEEVIGKTSLEINVWDNPEDRKKLTEGLKAEGKVENFEALFRTKDGDIMYGLLSAAIITLNGAEHILNVTRDITERKRAEEEVRRNEACLGKIVDILHYKADSVQDFLDHALGEALELTNSKIGYIYHYDEDRKEFVLNTWSKGVMKECSIADPQTVYQLEKTGIWGEAVRQRQPILVNDFQAPHPLKKGYPEGHARLNRYLTVPLSRGDRIVAVVGVANKESDYGQTDILQLTLLMDSVWKAVDRLQAEDQIQASLKEKELLLREIHHRVKNNLQVISSMIQLQAMDKSEKSREEALSELSNRIYAMALIHEHLHRSSKLADIGVKNYFRSLVNSIFSYWDLPATKVSLKVDVEDISWHIDTAIPVGLILNELLVNAFKHAFPDGRDGEIRISLSSIGDGEFELIVADNGVGMPEGVDPSTSKTLGLDLVGMFADQLHAEVELSRENGTEFRMRFKEIKKGKRKGAA